MIKVVHLTTVHPHDDNRIFRKECCSLAAAGYSVSLVAPGAPHFVDSGVKVLGVKRFRSRLLRFTITSMAVFAKALQENAALYHLHDFEMIPAGLALKLLGKCVVYDVHEDVSTQRKEWLPRYLGKMVSRLATMMERIADCTFDGIVVATEPIGRRFSSSKSALVRNFVLRAKEELPVTIPYCKRGQKILYAGVISQARGVEEMIGAVAAVGGEAQLVLVGSFSPPELALRCSQLPGFERVDWRGQVPPSRVTDILVEARIGIAILHPVVSYIESLPTKIFEYMFAGLPVIVSDFPVLRAILKDADCGVLVNPLDCSAVARAIRRLLENPAEAEAMGQRGRRAAAEKYTWEAEGSKLIALYRQILSRPSNETS